MKHNLQKSVVSAAKTRQIPRPVWRLVPLTLALGVTFSVLPTMTQAQEQIIQISITAQSLDDALLQLGRQTSLQLLYSADLVQGLRAPAVSGNLTPEQALGQLLSGSNLVFKREGNNVYLSRSPEAQTTQLGLVVVKAISNSSTEGSDSYTATGPSAMSSGLNLSLRETPQSVSVMTSQRMKDQNLTQLMDVANQTTGLVVSQGGNPGSDSSPIYARGFVVDNYMVDGVKMQSNYASLFQSQDMSLYDRVEVIRGASGLMNGIGSPGGAINLIRKKPFEDFRAEVMLEGGSWNHKRGMVDVSTPFNESGSVRGRLVLVGQNSKSYIERFHDKRQVAYGVVEADAGPETLFRAGFSHQRHDLTGHARGALPAYSEDGEQIRWSRHASAALDWAYSKRNSTTFFGEVEHELANNWQLKLEANRIITDSDELLGYAAGGFPNLETGAGVNVWASRWVYRPVQDSINLKANGYFDLFGREHEAAFGASWSRTHFESPSYASWNFPGWNSAVPDIFNWDGSTPLPPSNPELGSHGLDERNNGMFASVRLRPTDTLSVIAGTRYIDWRRDVSSYRLATQTGTTTRLKETKFVPYVGVTYDFAQDWTAYASYSSIFVPQSFKRVDGSYIDPLEGRSYEMGIKAELFDGVNLSAAVYQVKENNKAIAIPDVFAPDGSQAYEAKSGTKTKGFEIELAGAIQPNWELAASYALNHTKDSAGNRINTNLPKNTIKLFTTYKLSGAAQGLTVGGGVRWQDKIYNDNQGPKKVRFTQPAYAVADLMASYKVNKNLSTNLNIYNVFDKYYYTNAGSSYYGRPRSVMLSISSRF